MKSHLDRRIANVEKILSKPNLKIWPKNFWSDTLAQLHHSSRDDLVTHPAGQPHLWSETGRVVTYQEGSYYDKRH